MIRKISKGLVLAAVLSALAVGMASLSPVKPVQAQVKSADAVELQAGSRVSELDRVVAILVLEQAQAQIVGFTDKGQPVPTTNAIVANLGIERAIAQLGGHITPQ